MKQRNKILLNPVSFKIRVVYNNPLLTMSLITIKEAVKRLFSF